MVSVTTTKIITMALLAAISLFIGIIPLKLRHFIGKRENKKGEVLITSLLLCFGGGVLLCTSMVHILPEMREGLEGEGGKLAVFLGELILCGGFFLVYFVEEIVHLLLYKKNEEHLHRSFSLRKRDSDKNEEGRKSLTEMTCIHNDKMITNSEEKRGSLSSYNPKYEVKMRPSTASMFPNYHSPDQERNSAHEVPSKRNSTSEVPSQRNSTCEVQSQRNSTCEVPSQAENPSLVTAATAEAGHSHVVAQSNNMLRDLLTVLALSFHAVFEGMAIGLEEHEHDVWTLFAAVGCHKFVITFCIFVEIAQTSTKLLFYITYLLTFSLMSSIGIGVGLIISHVSAGGEYHQIYIAVLQGIAAGTILYIVMFEVLQREKSRGVSGLLQLSAIMTGFVVMLLLQIFLHHDHDQEDPEEHCHLHDICNKTHYLFHHPQNLSIIALEDVDHDSLGHRHEDLLNGTLYTVASRNMTHF